MLGIGHINIERCDIINDDMGGRLQTFLQLRDVEHIMHTRQRWWLLQLVCHNSQSSQDKKQTDVTWCPLAFDAKSLHTSCGRDTKVHTITSFELKLSTSLVGITLLLELGSIQVGQDAVDYFLGLSDKVRGKDHPFTRFNLVQRCMRSSAIQCFERCHLETLLIIVVIREFSQWHTLVPFVLIVQHTSTEHIFKNLVHSLCLTISLWVISWAVDQMHP
jgi:hypothetical protein